MGFRMVIPMAGVKIQCLDDRLPLEIYKYEDKSCVSKAVYIFKWLTI